MRIGILSDSHGRAQRVRTAIQLLDRLQAECLIHCGDVGGIPVFDELAGRNVHFVWGNTDDPSQGTLAYLRTVGLTPPRQVPLELRLDGKSIEVFHGHEREFERSIADPKVDYILHGHTHVAQDERIGGARVINPGALHRARVYTVALLDLKSDVLEFHEL